MSKRLWTPKMSHKQLYEFNTNDNFHGKPNKEIPTKAVLHGFRDKTSAHGIPHVHNSRGVIKRVWWTLATLICVTAFVYNFTHLAIKFDSFDVDVKVTIENKEKLVFPSITLCNGSPVRKSMFATNDDLKNTLGSRARKKRDTTRVLLGPDGRVFESYLRRKRAAPPQPTRTTPNNATADPDSGIRAPGSRTENRTALPGRLSTGGTVEPPTGAADSDPSAGSTPSDTVSFEEPPGFKPSDQNLSPDGRPRRENYAQRLRVLKILSDMNLNEKVLLGTQINDLILECEYNGYECYTRDFTTFYSNTFGNCYSFNSGWNGSLSVQDSFRPGPQHGLSMMINIDQDEYVGDLGDAAGIRVVIHPQRTIPFPEDEGVSVGPGLLTNVGVRMVHLSRKGPPYSMCINAEEKNTTRNVYEQRYNVKYTRSACYKTCYQYHLMKTCQCSDPQVPAEGRAFGQMAYKSCDSDKAREDECKTNVTDMFANGKLHCDCPLPCLETTYSSNISPILWPSDDYKNKLIAGLGASNTNVRKYFTNTKDPDKYRRSLLKLVVYFEEFNFESIVESPKYTWGSFISDIGGILGLYMGFSFLTIGEFLELGVDLIVLGFYKLCKKGSSSRANVSPVHERSLSALPAYSEPGTQNGATAM